MLLIWLIHLLFEFILGDHLDSHGAVMVQHESCDVKLSVHTLRADYSAKQNTACVWYFNVLDELHFHIQVVFKVLMWHVKGDTTSFK